MTPAEDSSSRSRGLTDHALRLVTREATRLPLFALSAGLQVWQHTRGLREMMLRHGGEALQIAAHTPIGRFLPQQVLDDGADDEAERIARRPARRAKAGSRRSPPRRLPASRPPTRARRRQRSRPRTRFPRRPARSALR